MPFEAVSFTEVSTEGLESSPVAEALAGLRANEARYFSDKYKHTFTVAPAAEAQDVLDWVEEILVSEREIVPTSPALEISINDIDGIYWVHVFYQSGLAINVLWTLADGGKRRRFQTLGGHGRAARAVGVQVRPSEVETGRGDPGIFLQDQGRPHPSRSVTPRNS